MDEKILGFLIGVVSGAMIMAAFMVAFYNIGIDIKDNHDQEQEGEASAKIRPLTDEEIKGLKV